MEQNNENNSNLNNNSNEKDFQKTNYNNQNFNNQNVNSTAFTTPNQSFNTPNAYNNSQTYNNHNNYYNGNIGNTNASYNNNMNYNNFKTNNAKNSSTYQTSKKPKSSFSFTKSILVPFVSGVLGTVIVVGACVGIPGIRDAISDRIVGSSSSNSSSKTVTLNAQQISLEDYSDTAIAAANKVLPSIVGIRIEFAVNSIFNRTSGTASASGSGIIISEDGYILTNNHVVDSTSSNTSSFYEVEEASKVIVTLYNDDTEYEAEIVGTDSQTDLAVIKIDKTGLTAAELGDSDGVQVGEFVMAVGNPLGLSSSVTSGIVSAVNREVTDSEGNTYNTIQTDASINAGNSGGALVNSQGQVIGVNTLKLSGSDVEGVGFAIPINSTKDISDQLIKYSKVKRPYMGIGGIDLDEETAKANNLVVGVYVKQIEDFSAAEKAGLRIGDVITEVDGQKITTMDEINEIKNSKNIGDTITLKVYRDGSTKELSLTLQEQP